MKTMVDILFALELALLFTHEMDAIRRQEWKMFIVLKDMADEKAYRVFLLLHIPLYTAILALLFSPFSQIAYVIVDLFLMAHMVIHLGFRKHPANRLNGPVSTFMIYAAGILGLLHFITVIAGWN